MRRTPGIAFIGSVVDYLERGAARQAVGP